MNDRGDGPIVFGIFTFLTILICGTVALGMWGCPRYNVWQQTLAGEAALKRAEWDRQTQIVEAQAKQQAASSLAQAEVERAKGVAQANQIIGDSLRQNEAYLRYLWIDNLDHAGNQIIYIPTEAGLPILEAGRGLALHATGK